MKTALLLFLLALGLRLGTIALIRDTPPVGEELMHVAQSIIDTTGRPTPPHEQRAPGIIFLFDVVQWLAGSSVIALRIACAVFGSAFVVVFYLWSRRVVDSPIAVCAAVLTAIHPELVVFSVSLWSESLYLFFMYASLFAIDVFFRDPKPMRAVACGVLLGLTSLTREIGLVFAVLLAADLFRADRTRPVFAATRAALLVGACVAVLLPWSITMSARAGHPVLTTMLNERRLFVGNIPIPESAKNRSSTGGVRIARGLREYAMLSIDPAERRRLARDQAIEAIRADLPRWPLRKLVNETRASFTLNSFPAARFFTGPPEDRWNDKFAFRLRPESVDRFMIGRLLGFATIAFYAVTTLSGAAGLALQPFGRTGWILFAFTIAHLAPTIVTHSISRYRVPLEPLLAIGCAAMILRGRKLWTGASTARRIVAVATVLVFAAIFLSTAAELLPPRLS